MPAAPDRPARPLAPPGYAGMFPYLSVPDADAYLRFLVAAFGAVELGRSVEQGGRIANARVSVGGTALMVSDASDEWPASSVGLYLYVADADAAMAAAIAAGARAVMAVDDMPYGDRQGGVRDPAGIVWWLSQRLTPLAYD